MTNIRDVARRAGVSTATVSRVLNAEPVVAAETRTAVLRAIKALRYSPNSVAKNLRTRRSGRLLVTLPTIANPYFALVLEGAEDAARRAGYSVLIGATAYQEDREDRYVEMLLRREAEGLMLLDPHLPKSAAEWIRSIAPRQAPVVSCGEWRPTLGVPGVHIDNVKAGWDAIDHLCVLGHRRIGVIPGASRISVNSRDRLKGARQRARHAHGSVELVVSEGDFYLPSGAAAADRLLASATPPTAIFTVGDEMAIGVLHAARRRGLRVPGDLSVVGFDDVRFSQYTDPPLTTVRIPMRALGETSVRLLLEILEGTSTRVESVTLPHELVIRESTAPPRTSQ